MTIATVMYLDINRYHLNRTEIHPYLLRRLAHIQVCLTRDAEGFQSNRWDSVLGYGTTVSLSGMKARIGRTHYTGVVTVAYPHIVRGQVLLQTHWTRFASSSLHSPIGL